MGGFALAGAHLRFDQHGGPTDLGPCDEAAHGMLDRMA